MSRSHEFFPSSIFLSPFLFGANVFCWKLCFVRYSSAIGQHDPFEEISRHAPLAARLTAVRQCLSGV